MRRIIFIILLSMLVVGSFSWLTIHQSKITYQSSQPTPVPTSTPLSSEKLWQIIQDWRTSQNLPKYIKDQRLCVIAIDRADDGLDYHAGFIKKIKSNYYGFTAGYAFQENSVFDAYTESDALDAWLNSPPHLKTLKASYTYSCVATYHQDAVEIFSNF